MNRIALLLTAALLLASAAAQETAPKEKVRTLTITQDEPLSLMPSNLMFQREKLAEGAVSFFTAEMAGTGETVTGAPYSATATTESTQVLADGNRIVNKSSAFVARDSQGRIRREANLGRLDQAQGDNAKLIFINDPTTHTQYVLRPGSNEATKVIRREGTLGEGPQIIDLRSPGDSGLKSKAEFMVRTRHGQEPKMEEETDKQVKHEDLGTQTIEGLSATGKRETVTIPAGQIGNERPIEIVSETWYSPELHTTVMRKHSDPRVGETTFKLTEIKRAEPDASLFQPPPGTKTLVEPVLELKRKMAPSKE